MRRVFEAVCSTAKILVRISIYGNTILKPILHFRFSHQHGRIDVVVRISTLARRLGTRNNLHQKLLNVQAVAPFKWIPVGWNHFLRSQSEQNLQGSEPIPVWPFYAEARNATDDLRGKYRFKLVVYIGVLHTVLLVDCG